MLLEVKIDQAYTTYTLALETEKKNGSSAIKKN